MGQAEFSRAMGRVANSAAFHRLSLVERQKFINEIDRCSSIKELPIKYQKIAMESKYVQSHASQLLK